MKLSDAHDLAVSEARYSFETVILEDGEGPRWKFSYDNWHRDPEPDILLLGAFRHPNTNNNLVGGINLHYINQDQRDRLARSLPAIMKSNSLKRRYWVGRQLVPDVFNNFYRTYNAQYIRGVTKDVMYPKYGYIKTAQDWLKKKLTSIFKPKRQREQENLPQYPDDLQSMQDRLDQAVNDLATDQEEPDDTPEMQAATRAFQDFQRQRTIKQLERHEDEPMQQAQREMDRAITTPGMQDAERNAGRQEIAPEPEIQKPTSVSPPPPPTAQELNQIKQREAAQQLNRLTQQNQIQNSRLQDVDPNIDIRPESDVEASIDDSDPPPEGLQTGDSIDSIDSIDSDPDLDDQDSLDNDPNLEESILFYSPISNSYVLERFDLL